MNMKRRIRVLYLTNVPSPYRVEYFNTLSKMCKLTVVYEKKMSNERDKKWTAKALDSYKSIYLKGISTGTDNAMCLGVTKFLSRKFDFIIICGISTPTQIVAINYCKIHSIPYYIESDGGIAKSGYGIRERFKRFLVGGACGYFSTCKRHDEYYITYGADEKRIIRYPFTSISESDIVQRVPSIEEKQLIKEKLKICGDVLVLSVGQFIYRKGFDVLIRSAARLKNIVFYIVGGKPTKEYIELMHRLDVHNVFFVEFLPKEELIKYYDAADLFVLPTREDIWGLVVNEAMARGVPVITTDNCNAGLEMIRNEENGFVVPTNDEKALVDAIKSLLSSNIKLVSQNALRTAQEYTLENMARQHIDIFRRIINRRIEKQ